MCSTTGRNRRTVAVGIIVSCSTACRSSENPHAPPSSANPVDREPSVPAGEARSPLAGRHIAGEAAGERGRYGEKVHALPAGCAPAGGKFSCNPLTNDGCNADEDEVCDDDDHHGFACYPESDSVQEGGDCNDKDGPSCAHGMTCDPVSASSPRGTCRSFCCTAADCRTSKMSKHCVALDPEFGSLGVCK
jgi:hypothetical protein